MSTVTTPRGVGFAVHSQTCYCKYVGQGPEGKKHVGDNLSVMKCFHYEHDEYFPSVEEVINRSIMDLVQSPGRDWSRLYQFYRM